MIQWRRRTGKRAGTGGSGQTEEMRGRERTGGTSGRGLGRARGQGSMQGGGGKWRKVEAGGQKRQGWRRRQQAADTMSEAGDEGGARAEYAFGRRRQVMGRTGCERSKRGKRVKGEGCGGAGVRGWVGGGDLLEGRR